MSDDKLAAATITASIVSRMTFSEESDISREALVIFRKIERAMRSLDEKSEVIAERQKKRREERGSSATDTDKTARRQERQAARSPTAQHPEATPTG